MTAPQFVASRRGIAPEVATPVTPGISTIFILAVMSFASWWSVQSLRYFRQQSAPMVRPLFLGLRLYTNLADRMANVPPGDEESDDAEKLGKQQALPQRNPPGSLLSDFPPSSYLRDVERR